MDTIVDLDRSRGVVASAAAGDEAAFARIVAMHHDDMVRVAFLVSAEADLAHEAVQAAWGLAWRRLHSLRDPSLLRPWLMSIAANEARWLMRKRRRRHLTEITVEAWGEATEPTGPRLDDHDRSLDLRRAMACLTPDERSAVAMRYVLGLTSAEIGRVTGLSAPGVRSRLARALERLRKELGDA